MILPFSKQNQYSKFIATVKQVTTRKETS